MADDARCTAAMPTPQVRDQFADTAAKMAELAAQARAEFNASLHDSWNTGVTACITAINKLWLAGRVNIVCDETADGLTTRFTINDRIVVTLDRDSGESDSLTTRRAELLDTATNLTLISTALDAFDPTLLTDVITHQLAHTPPTPVDLNSKAAWDDTATIVEAAINIVCHDLGISPNPLAPGRFTLTYEPNPAPHNHVTIGLRGQNSIMMKSPKLALILLAPYPPPRATIITILNYTLRPTTTPGNTDPK